MINGLYSYLLVHVNFVLKHAIGWLYMGKKHLILDSAGDGIPIRFLMLSLLLFTTYPHPYCIIAVVTFLIEQTYEDLDEILARFVQPMAANAKDLILNKCYLQAIGGNSEELMRKLQEEKAKNPKRIPYFFSASKQLPGKFLLGYQPGSKPRIEYVTVTPDGFRYRNRIHDNVNGLLAWFKEHYQDHAPRPVQTSSSSGGVSVGGAQIPSHIWHQQRENPYQERYMGDQLGGNRGAGSWRTAHTPAYTPAYTPTQTPHSVSSMYGGTPPVGKGGMTLRGRLEPPGTPVRDEYIG